MIITLAGAGYYLWTLDPLRWISPNGLFPYITAGIPSFVVSLVVYAASLGTSKQEENEIYSLFVVNNTSDSFNS